MWFARRIVDRPIGASSYNRDSCYVDSMVLEFVLRWRTNTNRQSVNAVYGFLLWSNERIIVNITACIIDCVARSKRTSAHTHTHKHTHTHTRTHYRTHARTHAHIHTHTLDLDPLPPISSHMILGDLASSDDSPMFIILKAGNIRCPTSDQSMYDRLIDFSLATGEAIGLY